MLHFGIACERVDDGMKQIEDGEPRSFLWRAIFRLYSFPFSERKSEC